MASTNSPVLQTPAQAVPNPAILTLKDFQLKNGIGPWMTRVRIARMWHEVDFMRTNEVTSLDLLLLDDSGDLLHAIVQKKFIWKFETLLQEGMLLCLNNLTFAPEKKIFRPAQNDYRAYFNWNTDVTPLELSTSAIPRHKFQLKRGSGNTCFMREMTLENISGMKLKVTLWGDSSSELTRNLEANGVNAQPIVAVVAGAYVKQYLGKASLSSTNATKIYFDVDIPEVLHIKERSSHRTPPREITLPSRAGYYPANQSIADSRKSIAELFKTKWESGYNALNKKICRAKALGISTDKGWYYLGCHNCTTKLVGHVGDHWCPSCKVQIDEPVPRFRLIYHANLLFVEGLAAVKAAFEPLIGVFQDYLIMVTAYNTQHQDAPTFTVAKFPSPLQQQLRPVLLRLPKSSVLKKSLCAIVIHPARNPACRR
ncbi:hypothetical protein MKW92_052768 [Papaver armeniacum]|nr:hypothetical protein MKW92_052768 [Papaver armeniacum]